jgi:hypothetical protein
MGIDNNFLHITSIAQEIRASTDKWNCIKFTEKETITRIKIQPKEWKKIFASYLSDKGIISRIYK